jgi:uncharacterized protein YbaA (DUF1428 family)
MKKQTSCARLRWVKRPGALTVLRRAQRFILHHALAKSSSGNIDQENHMNYVEGFVTAVPAANKQAYIDQAKMFAAILKEYGATRLVECWGDDLPVGSQTDFRMAVKAETEEAVVFSWIEYPSKDARDAANAQIMSDPRVLSAPKLFDTKRMIFGGFAPLVDE